MSKIEVNQISSQCGSTLTIGQSGDTVTLACGASQTGFGRTGTVNWDTTAKTANFTATSGDGFFCNTTSGAFTATLPAGSAGAIVSFADYAATWQTNNLTVSPDGTDKIGGENADVILNTEGQSVTFVYVDSTQGWINTMDSTSNVRGETFIVATGGTETTCGDFKIHTFTGPGTFTVCSVGSNPSCNVVDYLVVAGGGSGGAMDVNNAGGGGGAGGYRESSGAASGCYTRSPLGACVSALPVTAQGYPITVGSGGATFSSGNNPASQPNPGSNSVFSTITSAGGGGGGSNYTPTANLNGGSGGGGTPTQGASNGNTPPVSPPQGNPGGVVPWSGGPYPPTPQRAGGGGGGATATGSNASLGSGGPGGAGGTSSITASPVTRAAGGRGGNGSGNPGYPAGPANSGNGGGGGGGQSPSGTGAAGGSGIVIIRYKFQ